MTQKIIFLIRDWNLVSWSIQIHGHVKEDVRDYNPPVKLRNCMPRPSALRTERDGKEGRIEWGRQEKRKSDPNSTWLQHKDSKLKNNLIRFVNSLEKSQGGLLNSSDISKVWVEYFNFLLPKDSMDNDTIPPLILRNPYTTEMSRLDEILWHGVPIRNQLIGVAAPAKFRKTGNHPGEERPRSFLLMYQEQVSLGRKEKNPSDFWFVNAY